MVLQHLMSRLKITEGPKLSVSKSSNPRKPQKARTVRKSVPKSLKDLLWDTSFGPEVGQANCYVCGTIINSKKFEAGHVVAVAKGGRTILSNLRCICGTCNKSMGTENLDEFKAKYFGNHDITLPDPDPDSDPDPNPDLPPEESDMEVEMDPPIHIIEPCWLCHEETMMEFIHNKKYIDCPDNPKLVCHYECWKEYLKVATQRLGRRATFMRTTDCPHCLDKEWCIISSFTT